MRYSTVSYLGFSLFLLFVSIPLFYIPSLSIYLPLSCFSGPIFSYILWQLSPMTSFHRCAVSFSLVGVASLLGSFASKALNIHEEKSNHSSLLITRWTKTTEAKGSLKNGRWREAWRKWMNASRRVCFLLLNAFFFFSPILRSFVVFLILLFVFFSSF